MSHIFVVKKNGEREPFSEEKVIRSMQRVGLSHDHYQEVLQTIKSNLHNNITTQEIYSQILQNMRTKNVVASVRFNLKQAIFELGPTGFPFEKFIARIFENQGYTTQLDLVLRGECVNHETDIILEKDGKREIAEVKFHNEIGIKTDIHVAMYTFARYWDLREIHHLADVWVITNTKLTDDAIAYAECKKMKTIAWNYPEKNNLQDFVENPALYPITILPLSREEKQRLLTGGIILCTEFLNTSETTLQESFALHPDSVKKAREHAEIAQEK